MTESAVPPRLGGSYLRLPDGSLQPIAEPAEAAPLTDIPTSPAAPAEPPRKKRGAE